MLAQPQMYRCPQDINYDVAVAGDHLTLVALYDQTECSLKGDLAHCKVVGSSLLHGDVYDLRVKISPATVTLFNAVDQSKIVTCEASHSTASP